MDEVWSEARRQVDARREKGIKRNCIIDRILDGDKQIDLDLSRKQLNHFLGVLVEGGADTTSSSVLTSVLFMALNPKYQTKARVEIDAACGPDKYVSIKTCHNQEFH